jgi:lipopolysaccharide/colanic/teichoic acid biosynthesis glycosyltransferase
MQETTPKVVRSKPVGLGFLVLSTLLGNSIYWVIRQTWYGNLHWIIPVLIIASFTAAFSKWTTGNYSKNKAYRLAIIISFTIIVSCWAVLWLVNGTRLSFLLLGGFLAASLLGGMIVSWFEYGIADETFIPSQDVTSEIQKVYQRRHPESFHLPFSKRLFDIFLAAVGILVSLHLWLVITCLIWLQDPGPIVFVKHCSGYQGKPFRLYKFRTMMINAEVDTGPIVSDEKDSRVLKVGKILRKTALDELPQLVNILVGEMSFVGPRPLRSVVEVENVYQIPGYTYRFNILPGLAGLAQICGDNMLPSRDKLRYERVYAQNVSVLFDLKIVVIAFLTVLYLRWKKDWDGRVPRSWIRFGC